MVDGCPKCGESTIIRNGKIQCGQRWKCKSCNFQFTRTLPRGKPLWQKSLVIFFYCNGISMNSLAKMFQVEPSTILKWVRTFTKEHYGKPEPAGNTVIMKLDDMNELMKNCQLEKTPGTVWIAIQDKCFAENIGISISSQHEE